LKSALLTRRNVFYLNIAITVVLIFSTLFFIRDMISRHFERQKTAAKNISSAPAAVQTRQQRPQFADYSSILKNNPFGFPGGELRPLTASAGTKGQPAGLALIGTVAGPKELSYAIFKDNSGVQEVFKVGEPVYGLGVLSMVKKEKVLLRKGGSVTEIPLEDVQVKEIRNPTAENPGSQFARRIGSGSYVVDQARLQQAIANPGQMMTDARLRPNVTNGKQEGFALSEVKPGGIYQSLGLQDGDILLRINDYDISNPERALQAFTALRGLDRVQIDLIRSGSKMTMTYQIK
jgi:general secretion pathway protein C